MHGCSPVFTILVNAEVDSMGGVVDCEVGLDAKSSPHHAAIAKAQEELRLEYDVREERRRELEFLEKGGNPLDYKFGRATSISLQSTSLRDQLAEQHVMSEAKGSFALAASPHGDSVESSGRPAGSMGREPNIADNLLLFAGESSSPGREKNARRTGKRSNAAPAEQSSKIDGYRNTKESNDLMVFRLESGGQAYARRNRYRSSRDSHSNKSPLLPSSHSSAREVKESHVEVHPDTVSSIINSKPKSPNAKRKQKSFTSKDQLDMEIDGGLARHTHTNTENAELQVAKSNAFENLNVDCKATSVEQVAKSSAMQTPDFIGKESTVSVPLCSMDNIKESGHDEKDKSHRVADVDILNAHEDNITAKENVSNIFTEVVGKKNADINPLFVSTAHLHGSADSSDSLTFRIGVSVGINSKDHATGQVTSGNSAVENSQIAGSAACITSNGEARTSQIKFNNSVRVKDEVLSCEKSDKQMVDRLISNVETRLNKKSEISQDDATNAIKASTIMANSICHSHELSSEILSKMVSTAAAESQSSESNQLKLAKKAHEDAILKAARRIETSLKWAGVPSMSCISSEKQRKCHWHFVLEEMTWMANDFMQERLWKITAAAQVCHRIVIVGRSKFEQENLCQKQRNVARTLAKAVMNFWNSVGAILTKSEASSGMKEDCSNISSLNTMKDQSVEACGGFLKPGIQSYACRILKYLSDISSDPILAEAPRTPDRIKDAGSFGVFLDDQLSEENLFYKVLPGAMNSYRESIESRYAHVKEEECEASMCDSVAGGTRGIAYEEDEDETGTDFLPGSFEGNYFTKFIHKKRKIYQQKSYAARYDTDLSYDPCLEGKSANHSRVIMGKRPSGILNVSAVPTKRTRTAARQRIVSPFSTGPIGSLPVTSKTDVSSGDTASFQDDYSSRHGCSQPQKNFEVDSAVDFDRLLSYDSSDIPMKLKKKKKPKHLGYKSSLNLPDSKAASYEQRLQSDYMVQHDQRDHVKKRCEGLQFESNGNMGFYGQNVAKKPKISKRAESPETMTPAGGSMPSPVASQMSNMSNSNKLIKLISSRDRGRKSKVPKMATGHSGPGIAWSTFEDQALVVLVHDMGLNWELVSDALNSTLHFKCIYRKSLDCKERHKFLMDKSAGDGDSAEDSGSSQPYQSTLPGIPKGSARQLFQRLQGPLEEDTMKSHFEKIILIGQRLRSCRTQDNKQLLKQITPAHSSHVLALSKACPNNLTGPTLSPVDLANAVNSNSDAVGLGYQGSNTNGMVIPGHQGSLAPVLPTSSTNTMLQGTPSMVLGSGLPTPSPPLHAPPRYGVHRAATLPIDDQKRLQQYGQNFSGRNMQQSGIPMTNALPAGVDRGVRMLPGGNGMGMMCGVNRSMPMPRTTFQGVSPSGMLNMVSPNNMLSGNVVGIPSPMGAHSSAVSSPGSTMLRPRDALPMLRPGQGTEETRQIMMQEIQMHASQGNSQSIAPLNGMSAPFSNAPVPPPVQTIPLQQHQPHILGNPNNSHIQGTNHSSSQQQAYIRFTKESQLQQRIIPQAPHPYSGSSAMSPMENNSQFQQQNQSSSPVNSIASSQPQPQHKQQPMPRNPQTSSMMSSPIIKQRQRQQAQQQQQQTRNLQQQKQQAQQQGKLMKGLGRGSMLLHHNSPVDATQVGGRSTTSNQTSEKLLMQQNQGFNPVSTGLNSNLQQPSISQKLHSRLHPPQSKQAQPMPSHIDNNQAQGPPMHSMRATQQSVPSTPPATQQQQQHRQANQSPTNMQRIILPQNRQLNHDGRIQSSNESVQGNQMIASSSLPKTSDSSSLPGAVSLGVHWKPEPSFETCTAGENAQLAAIPQESFAGNDAMIPPSTQGLVQRQLSGNISMHGHGVGGQWQQQQQLQSTSLPQQQHRQGVQGNLYTRSSNTGP